MIHLDPITAMFGLISLWLFGALIIELHAARYWMNRRVNLHVDAVMLAHKRHHAECGAAQSANDNHEQNNSHRFISFEKI